METIFAVYRYVGDTSRVIKLLVASVPWSGPTSDEIHEPEHTAVLHLGHET